MHKSGNDDEDDSNNVDETEVSSTDATSNQQQQHLWRTSSAGSNLYNIGNSIPAENIRPSCRHNAPLGDNALENILCSSYTNERNAVSFSQLKFDFL